MANFEVGEHVICSITVKDADGDLQDAATSMSIVVEHIGSNGSLISTPITSTSMTKDSTGTYHYDAATATLSKGTYRITYTATDGSRITIQTDTFQLV